MPVSSSWSIPKGFLQSSVQQTAPITDSFHQILQGTNNTAHLHVSRCDNEPPCSFSQLSLVCFVTSIKLSIPAAHKMAHHHSYPTLQLRHGYCDLLEHPPPLPILLLSLWVYKCARRDQRTFGCQFSPSTM